MNLHKTVIKGVFCISLDFEKFWGVRDVAELSEIEDRFKKIESLVISMLQLFEKYEVHATWAIVGLLNHNSLDELIEKKHSRNISYLTKDFSPYPINKERYQKVPVDILTAKKEIELILKKPHQELASHTYAHYFTLEAGQNEFEFRADLDAMNQLGKDLKHEFRTIIFPRNQVNQEYLKLLSGSGYIAYRGNQRNRDWQSSAFYSESKSQKVRRVIDAYLKISKTKSFTLDELRIVQGLVDIPASRFLRPNKGNSLLERLKLNRIKSEMDAASQRGAIYHLWWHPHNFTFEPEMSLIQLEEILKHYQNLNKAYEFTSLNMGEIAEHVKK